MKRTAAEREAARLVAEMIGEHHEEPTDLPRTLEAMLRVERATLARVRKAIRALDAELPIERAVIADALACCRPERSRR